MPQRSRALFGLCLRYKPACPERMIARTPDGQPRRAGRSRLAPRAVGTDWGSDPLINPTGKVFKIGFTVIVETVRIGAVAKVALILCASLRCFVLACQSRRCLASEAEISSILGDRISRGSQWRLQQTHQKRGSMGEPNQKIPCGCEANRAIKQNGHSKSLYRLPLAQISPALAAVVFIDGESICSVRRPKWNNCRHCDSIQRQLGIRFR
jgi:hypothetical protein